MRTPFIAAFVFLLSLSILPFGAAKADDFKPDDLVTFDLNTEGWVTTKTARVMVSVDAAVAGAATSTMRADMQKALSDLAKTEWRLIGFYRSQDSSGLERWNASFEARLAEAGLAGIHENAKKLSKAGMQITISNVDFSPTLEETETVKAALRADLYKMAAVQLATLNGSFPARQYRIAAIDFNGAGTAHFMTQNFAQPMMMRAKGAMMADTAMAPTTEQGGGGMERAEKITMTARVVMAAIAPMTMPPMATPKTQQ
jgi:hypothetical protein